MKIMSFLYNGILSIITTSLVLVMDFLLPERFSYGFTQIDFAFIMFFCFILFNQLDVWDISK